MLQLQIDRLEHRDETACFTHGGSPREMTAMMGVQPVAWEYIIGRRRILWGWRSSVDDTSHKYA